jgi:molybdopterin adenylyltransferase
MSVDPAKIGLISISDRASKGIYQDEGLPALEGWLKSALKNPLTVVSRVIPDEQPLIEATLKEFVDTEQCSLVLTTGGTGPAPSSTRSNARWC